MSKSIYKEVQNEFSIRLNTTEDVAWQTFPKFADEMAHYGAKYEKEQNENGLKRLEEFDHFVTEMEKKYPKL